MNNKKNPIYLDWSFWTALLALVAIVLSQVPPIHILLKSAELNLEVHSKISITHKVGNPNLQMHLSLSNIGGRKVKVREMKVSLRRDGLHVMELPAQNFLQNQSDNDPVLLTVFSLKPNQDWAHITNFLNVFGRVDAREYSQLDRAMQEDYRQRIKLLENQNTRPASQDPIELAPELAKAAFRFHESHFRWEAGEYQMKVHVLTDNPNADITRNYRFTVFESHTATLLEIRNYYKYGGGFWWNPPNIPLSVYIDLYEE